MWKLLRNLLLAGVLVAGALKLLAWYEVGQDAQRIAAALAPTLQVRYDSVSAGLDGSVSFANFSATLKRDKAPETYSAERLVLETPGLFWLLKHALLDDRSLPAHFGVAVQGLKIPPTPWLDSHWFNAATLVPFETAGCAAVTLSPADYRKMDVAVGDVRQHGEFRYDADAKTLDATLNMSSAGIAALSLEASLRQFEPTMLKSSDAIKRVQVERLALNYTDNGYFKRRNQFCAQRASIAPNQFVEQHLGAVQAMLQQHGVEAGAELLKVYRRLVENGGQMNLLSLPNSGFVVAAWTNSTPEDMLRQMNVTARYGDAPPVMFRLNFPTPAQPTEAATASAEPPAAIASPTGTANAGVPAPAPTATEKPIVSATTAPVAPPPATASAATAPSAPVLPTPAAPSTPKPPPAPAVSDLSATAKPAAPATRPVPELAAKPEPKATTPPAASDTPTGSGNGLEEFDKAAAKLAPLPKRKPGGTPDFLPSEPPPSGDSTLALVWKPTIERLPAAAPEQRDYDVIDFAALNAQRGRYVRLITEGGKKVEGYVVSADDSDVQLRVHPSGGNAAQFSVPRTRIQEIQLVRRSSPPA